ncbi:scoloptoxin SSD976-like isoform X2 [Contarinia nasturtii]|uniref:scoloptoxin SSD976-like isoform X2 n=1 Tax=Contarinia nasturtii TaxID=265458 RepID=UPI0012D3F554|nr:scoloptoxin SSD976-like isoform X2 [Contarinia nasturtii]
MILQYFIVFIICVSAIKANIDYCEFNDLCPTGTNVCCNTKGFPESYQGARIIPFTDELIEYTLNEMNLCRQKIASGDQCGYEPAKKMHALYWDPELAVVITCNVGTGIYGHDECRNTPRFRCAGQNIYITSHSKGHIDPTEVILKALFAWYDENKECNMEEIEKGMTQGWGHFTQMISDQCTCVGCAMSQWEIDGSFISYFGCNYDVTNMKSKPVYECGKPGSECTNGLHPIFSSLCNIKNEDD